MIKYLSPQEEVIKPDVGSLIYNPEWDNNANKELNTYKSYKPIALEVEPIFHDEKEGEDITEFLPFNSKDENHKYFEGRHSLFNATHAVGNELVYQVELNTPLLDSPKTREVIRSKSDCSIKALVNASARGEMGRAVYTYADFMFCKHLGRMSNNYLITLRRFPHPPGDHINLTNSSDVNEHLPDIGRMVTWLGTPGNEMSGILKYDINLPYEEMKAQIQDAYANADNSGGFLGGLMNLASGSYKQGMLNGSDGKHGIGVIQQMASPFGKVGKFISGNLLPPEDNAWAYHKDETKQYGPVDAITSTYYRQGAEHGGIKFEQNITLVFDYELRSYNGINTRSAMLDLLANILAVTFTDATYWGGAIRGTGAAQSNIFSNLPIFHMNEPLTFANVQDGIFESIGQVAKEFNNNKPINGVKDVVNMLGNLASGIFTGITAGLLNKLGRPQRNALNSLINFQPTGLWHLMIGNPKHPIMSMGNMILDNCSIEHYGPLGLDDFPTGLKVTITLKHGMPRDNLKIEQMYMNGDYRIYHALDSRIYDIWAGATEVNESASKKPKKKSTDKPETLADTVDIAKETMGVKSTEEKSSDDAVAHKRFLKYFGIDNRDAIITAGKEANFGSNKKGKKKNSTGQM